MTSAHLKGRKILVVEDDYMQALEVAGYLESEGVEVVGPTGRAADVPRLLASNTVEAALLDINLGRGSSFDTAEELQRQGIPFAFLTGYDKSAIPSHLSSVPRLEKPASERAIMRLIRSLV